MKYFYALLLFILVNPLFSKQRLLEFKVLDTADLPLEGVTILLEWSNTIGGKTIQKKLVTDANGYAQLTFRKNPSNYHFYFSKKGYFNEQEGPYGKGGSFNLFRNNKTNVLIEQWMQPKTKINANAISEKLVGITVQEFINYFKISGREYKVHWFGYYKGYSLYNNRWGRISRSLTIETEDSLRIILLYKADTLVYNLYEDIKNNTINTIGICLPDCSIKVYGQKDSLSYFKNENCIE